jgi:hypothetical protein
MRDVAGGMTVEESIEKNKWDIKNTQSEIKNTQSDRAMRQQYLCEWATVSEWVSCCGGKKRPKRILCSKHGSIPWASCLMCKDYHKSGVKVKKL